jgi:hypothetical protein
MKINTQLAQAVRDTGATFTLADLDLRFQALLRQLEDNGICHRGLSTWNAILTPTYGIHPPEHYAIMPAERQAFCRGR